MNIGCLEASRTPTRLFNERGQNSDAPRGVVPQANVRIVPPMTPPPMKNGSSDVGTICASFSSNGFQSRPGEFGQGDKWSFCLTAAMMPLNRERR